MLKEAYKKSPYFKNQKGISLIEVLVSMLLMSIIGLGAAFVTGRTAVMHRDQNIHLHTVNQLRAELEENGCNSVVGQHDLQIEIADQSISLNCEVEDNGYTVSAFDHVNNGVKSSGVNEIIVRSTALSIADTDTFVPVKVQMTP
ncbi:prepilin-type N-terminal cleavage/methylation domain-containing protein [Acinetobacter sp. Marseille-Q1618]|uniref:prepilin-type N-terminal cleavage/methylation domain-containing protein n=1 Tax=Acinetobacter sp. Marseille-Q1618 TaxID=2697502 RepID=UPI00156F4C41|nr:prepilin-type N-terminal cleavage/methylation domain-containing protein [Acinetobacter sp. Marseille-Q1618]